MKTKKENNIEIVDGMEQFCFGEIKALQTKRPRKDKGSSGCPLFEQEEPKDPGQQNLFDGEEEK